jgi:hypothetical protein
MNVWLSKEVLDDKSKYRDLQDLIHLVFRREHTLSFDRRITRIPEEFHPNDIEILEQYMAASEIGESMTPSCEVITDASDIHDEKRFSVEEALEYVGSSLRILVENNSNDSALILAIISAYLPSDSLSGNAYYGQRLLEFDNAGGCMNVEPFLEEKLRQLNGRTKFLRYFVVLDGDKRYPEHEVVKYDKMKRSLDSMKIPYHILEKRCMENYLPVECFPDSDLNREWLSAYRALLPRQRDFLNIAKGFADDLSDRNRRELCADCSNLRDLMDESQAAFYHDVSDENLRRLASNYKVRGSFKSEFPRNFNDGRVNRSSLDAIQAHQDNPQELRSLAEAIAALI